jgi:hypothetical protein
MDGATAGAVLGVAQDATEREIVLAYRARAKQAHPDATGSAEAFVSLRAAFDHLLAAARSGRPSPRSTTVSSRGDTGAWLRPAPGPRHTIDLTDRASAPARPSRPSTNAVPTAAGRSFDAHLAAQLARSHR